MTRFERLARAAMQEFIDQVDNGELCSITPAYRAFAQALAAYIEPVKGEIAPAEQRSYDNWLESNAKYIHQADFWAWLETSYVDGLRAGAQSQLQSPGVAT